MSLPIPKKVPEPGFYYHYKHDPKGEPNNYAYEVLGVGFHTEDSTREGEEHFVIYRPLYESASVYQQSLKLRIPCFDARPLEMWMGNVEVGGKTFPRFKKITDPYLLGEIGRIREQLY
jgi:hypothetical protein